MACREPVWTQTNGGPLIALEPAALPYWRGVTDDRDPTAPDTDYGRACAVRGLVQLIPVGPHQGLVFGGDCMLPMTCVRLEDGLLLLMQVYGTTGRVDALAADGRRIAQAAPAEEVRLLVAEEAGLVVFDSACSGKDAFLEQSPYEERLPGLHVVCPRGLLRVRSAVVDDAIVHALSIVPR